jgi:hypothetical protein
MLEEPLSCNTAPNRLTVFIWDETEGGSAQSDYLAVRPRGTHELFTKFGTEPKLEWTCFRGGRSTSVL